MTTNHIFVFNSICPPQILYHPIIFLVPSPYVAHMCSYISMLHFVPILPTYIYFPSFLFSCASYTCASPAAARQFDLIFSSQFYLFDFYALSCLTSLKLQLRDFFCESYKEYSPLKIFIINSHGHYNSCLKMKGPELNMFLM